MSNPFTPPNAPVEDPKESPQGPRKGARVKALLWGLAVDIGGTLVLSVALGIAYSISLAASGMSAEQIAANASDLPMDSWIMIVGYVGGCMFSALGGYVCARKAGENEFALGAVMAVMSVVLGVLLGSRQSFAMHLVGAVLTFFAVMIGVRFGAVKNRQR
ncbi:hypothetical protein [Viridibacterium curvum]|uniref:TIGR04086 family membrane protein n=1 Tax=Viridibacterium curvum TaxID=1101404 RepID=A0ABP9QTB9_9RHOO